MGRIIVASAPCFVRNMPDAAYKALGAGSGIE
jgi:hypothetical protein